VNGVKFLNEDDANQFLRSLGLRIDPAIILRITDHLRGKNKLTPAEIYANGLRRDGSPHTPICSKNTFRKIKKLYIQGYLEPYLNYQNAKYSAAIENEITRAINAMKVDYSEKTEALKNIQWILEFISEWEEEIPLHLEYLDSVDLSGKTGSFWNGSIEHTDWLISWERKPNSDIIRKFRVEDSDAFKALIKNVPDYQILWKPFKECQIIGGSIIKECSEFGFSIKKEAENRTGLKVMQYDPKAPEQYYFRLRLDQYFSWTIYADCLGIGPTVKKKPEYHFSPIGQGLYDIIDENSNRLATVGVDKKDEIVKIHREMRENYRGSKAVKRVIVLRRQLDAAEIHLREQLTAISKRLNRSQIVD
jgi:hypothetical protein